MIKILIVVDTNDADYVTEITDIELNDLIKLYPLIEKIKNNKEGYNYYRMDGYGPDDISPEEKYPDTPQEIFDEFEKYLPKNLEYGFHSIESIDVLYVREVQKLL